MTPDELAAARRENLEARDRVLREMQERKEYRMLNPDPPSEWSPRAMPPAPTHSPAPVQPPFVVTKQLFEDSINLLIDEINSLKQRLDDQQTQIDSLRAELQRERSLGLFGNLIRRTKPDVAA